MVDIKAASINIVYLLICFFIWVACLDAWGGELCYVATDGTSITVSFFYDHSEISSGGGSFTYKSCADVSSYCKKCSSGGGGIVAMTVFAWFAAWGSLVLGGMRAAGKEAMLPRLNLDADKCLRLEFFLMIAETVLFFFGIIAWGTCYSEIDNNLASSQTIGASGFGFIIFVFLLQLGTIPLIWFLRQHPELHRIVGGSAAPPKTNDNPAQPPASSAGQTNSGAIDPAPQQQNPNDLPR